MKQWITSSYEYNIPYELQECVEEKFKIQQMRRFLCDEKIKRRSYKDAGLKIIKYLNR